MKRKRVSYEMQVRLSKAMFAGRISPRTRARILTEYPYLSLLDWLKLWRATWRIKA